MSEEVYCCDEYGRPFVIRTIEGKRRPIAVYDFLARTFKQILRDENPKDVEKFCERLREYIAKSDLSKKFLEKEKFEKFFDKLDEILDSFSRENPDFREIVMKTKERKNEIKSTLSNYIRILNRELMEIRIETRPSLIKRVYEIINVPSLADLKFIRRFHTTFVEKAGELLFKGKIRHEIFKLINNTLNKGSPEEKAKLLMIYESIKRIEIAKIILRRHLLQHRNKTLILLGSATRYESTPVSDIEIFIYNPGETPELQERDIRRLIEENLGIFVDIKYGKPEEVYDWAMQSRRDEERERRLTWLITPIIDGVYINYKIYQGENIEPDIREIIRDFLGTIRGIQKVEVGKEIKWIIERHLAGARERLRDFAHSPSPHIAHHIVCLSIRALAIHKFYEEKKDLWETIMEVRLEENKPFWFVYEKINLSDFSDVIEKTLRLRIGEKEILQDDTYRRKLSDLIREVRHRIRFR